MQEQVGFSSKVLRECLSVEDLQVLTTMEKKTKHKYKMDEFLVAAAVYNLEPALFLFLKHKNYVLE